MNPAKYPSSLTKCPIIEMSLDMMCSFNFPFDAIVGIIYSSIQNSGSFGNIQLQKLPICNVPIEIRRNDPNLKNRPTHQISCDNGLILIGEGIISLGIIPPYKSWETFRSFISNVMQILKDVKIIKNISTANIRYLNFFELNIFDKSNLSVLLGSESMLFQSSVFKTEIPSKENKDVVSVLQITDGVHVENKSLGMSSDGSLIDIRVVSKEASIENIETKIECIHIEAKSLFFSLLKDDFVDALK